MKKLTWKLGAKHWAVIGVLISALAIAGVLLYSIFYQYENILAMLSGIVGSGIFGLIVAWFVNSYLARDLEKRKKKYDIKYESYSGVHKNIESLLQLGRVWHLHELVRKVVEGKGEAKRGKKHVSSGTLILQYLGELEVLRATIGGEVQSEFFEELSERSILGMSFDDETEVPDEEEFKERLKKRLDKHTGLMMNYWVTILRDLDKSISRVKLIGSLDTSKNVGEFVMLFTKQAFDVEMLDSETSILLAHLKEKLTELESFADGVETSLAIDLDKTL